MTKFVWPIIVLALFTSSCGKQTNLKKKDHYTFATNGAQGKRKTWGPNLKRTPLKIGISESFFQDELHGYTPGKNPFEDMAKQWDGVFPAVPLFIFPFAKIKNKEYTNISNYNDDEMGIYKSFRWFSNIPKTSLAVTYFSGEIINNGGAGEYILFKHTDIILNYANHRFSLTPKTKGEYDLGSLALHELGHVLGLNHKKDTQSRVMYPQMAANTLKRTLYDLDKTDLHTLYKDDFKATENSISSKMAFQSSGGPVEGYMELTATGLCRHYILGRGLIHQHSVATPRKK